MRKRNKEKEREYKRRRYEEIFKPAYDAFIKLYPFDTTDLPDEVWLPVPDYADYHESNYGRTKSTKNGKVTIRKPLLHKDGYLYVDLCKDGTQKDFSVARLVATCFIPNPDLKPEVNHLHGRFNNFVDCLEWATSAENSKHAFAAGLNVAAQGTDVYNAAVKDEAKILYIRNNPDNLTIYQLAEMFNTTPTTISEIQLGKKYANCGGQIREPQKRRYLTDEEKAEIRRLYVKGSSEFGSYALARIFGCSQPYILKIVHAQ